MPSPPRCGAGGIPKILTTLIDRLDEYLADPSTCLPSLNRANGSDRQQRLERRSACVQLLRAHVKYLDLVSLRVGIPQRDGGFMSLTLPFLAKQADIGLRRAERAMHDLQLAGLVRTWQRCEKSEDGQYKGLAALRQLPAALFGAFGLGKWLRHERRKAVMRRNRGVAAEAKAQRRGRKEAQGSLFMNGLKHRMQQGFGKASRPAPDDCESEIRRRVGILKMQHPEWDRDACYAQAYREQNAAAYRSPGNARSR